VAELIRGGFTASKIQRAVFFSDRFSGNKYSVTDSAIGGG